MATRFKNEKNFLIIKMSWREYVACTETWGLCDCCGESDFDTGGYYIATIDSWFCQKCFDAYISTATHHRTDLKMEQQRWSKMVGKLRDLGTWENE